MRLGVGRLLLAIASVAVRMSGDHDTADLLAFAFLAGATLNALPHAQSSARRSAPSVPEPPSAV